MVHVSDTSTKDLLHVDVDGEDDWDLTGIPPSGCLHLWSIMFGSLNAIRENWALRVLENSMKAAEVFDTDLGVLNTIYEHGHDLGQMADWQKLI